MYRSDFHYDLPPELIADKPLAERADSRLLVVSAADFTDQIVRDIPSLIGANDLLVFNNTEVLKARLHGHKPTGGQVEILLERMLQGEDTPEFIGQVRASKAPRPGTIINLGSAASVEVIEKLEGGFYRLKANQPVLELLRSSGEIPLPPYIERSVTADDYQRYQTVFASEPGAVAAPTAGLHFDLALLDAIKQAGAEIGFTTLHVGAGTFQPVRETHIEDHAMHLEYLIVDEELCQQIRRAQAVGGRIIAVGTTTLRALETAARSGKIEPYAGDTNIFIYPGYEFKLIDVLMTNFHLPESTLLMLVSALMGREPTLRAYEYAIQQGYRFFSYGDAMWLDRALL